MKVSDYVMQTVASHGVKHVFMLPGGGAMHLNDSLGRTPGLEFVCNLHEQAAAIAAEAYAKATGGLGVALVTTGPGSTNAVTGVVGAWQDSTPCLFISGQVKTPDLRGTSAVRQMGVQEVDIVAIVASVTKYAVTVTDPSSIRFHLEKALHLAHAGRPGPVWIDIPLDVQAATIDVDSLVGFDPEPEASPASLEQDVLHCIELLNAAERPVVLIGNGVRLAGAESRIDELLALLRAPVLTTWLAIDLIADDHPLFAGRPGAVAPRGANFTLQNSDFLLVLGARLDLVLTAFSHERLARGARKVMVDVDAAELKKMKTAIDVPVCADVGNFIAELMRHSDHVSRRDRTAWIGRTQEWKARYPLVADEHRDPAKPISVYHLADVASEVLEEGATIVSGSSGAGIEIFLLALRVKRRQRVIHTTALGAMGFGLPATIGASLGRGGAPVFCVDGDGGFQLNIQELATVARLNLPIKFFILSNEGFSSIRTSQLQWFGRLVAADSSSGLTFPNVRRVAEAYGIATAVLDCPEQLEAQLRNVLAMPGPVVCEVMTIPDETRAPRVSSYQRADGSMVSRPLEDMWPFLDREEFRANMIVPPIEE
jgi:acetolactate synthase I/II/III large subunit